MNQISLIDLYFVIVSAVIFGGILAAVSIAAITRYSRHEERGNENYPRAWQDLGLILLTGAFALYGMYRAGLFG